MHLLTVEKLLDKINLKQASVLERIFQMVEFIWLHCELLSMLPLMILPSPAVVALSKKPYHLIDKDKRMSSFTSTVDSKGGAPIVGGHDGE